jgi:opacity protein-like surface antigen
LTRPEALVDIFSAGGKIMPTLKQNLLGGAALLALFDTSAAIAASPAYSWTGFYFGGHAGYGWGSVDGDTRRTVVIPPPAAPNFFVNTPNPVPFIFDRGLNPQGGLGGLQAGYNFQSGRTVYGVEADFTWAGQDSSVFLSGDTRPVFFNTEDFSYTETTSAKLKYMGTVRGRLGYTVGALLPYVTGGFAWGRMSMDTNWLLHQFNQVANLPFAGSESHTHVGWTLGAGFEYAFAERWSAKAEYLFVDLGKQTYFSGIQGGGSFGMQDHTVRIGINFWP